MRTMRRLILTVAGALAVAGAASASTSDDTTSGSISGVQIQNINAGHSSYAYFFFPFGTTCGTASTYNTNGIRISTSHPRYQDMLKQVQAAVLSRNQVFVYYENISGQCWAKRITLWNQ